ncbi:MAG TPA: VCBS repeat-containing protein [Candidatus Bathyarchaeia archaeon]|nr:VCBS repeat-containing protein [Candidatus Bathyarchaeia archaeon]
MVTFFCFMVLALFSAPGDWPEPRHNACLTGIQPLSGAIKEPPTVLASFDLGRSVPAVTPVNLPAGDALGLCIVAGALQCYAPDGTLNWSSHPPGINFTAITATEDLDGDSAIEVLLSAGRPTEPYGAAVLVSLADGRLLWRYDVEPMSYAWYLFAGNYLPPKAGASKQIVVMMHAYPPDPQNGYIALFEFAAPGQPPTQRWRYDFSEYTCFPSLLQTDLEGDGVKEIVVETHSRMWILDAETGQVEQFVKWDVSPANVRSYGLVQFTDLDGDDREDFLCIATFAQHHEVLLNKGGQLEPAWHYGWPESVTTGKVATVWAEPPAADVDGDGKLEIVLSMFNSENESAWLLRIYDAVSGDLKYRKPGVFAVSSIDANGDGAAEILCNSSRDATRAACDGAVLLGVQDGVLTTLWEDARSKAVDPKKKVRAPDAPQVARIERDGQTFTLELAGAEPVLAPWEKPEKPVSVDFSAVPAVVGPPFPVLLAADADSDGRNELVLYQEPAVKVLRLERGALNVVGEYVSSCAPVFADFNGDGKTDIALADVAPEHTPVVEVRTPGLENAALWRAQLPPPERTGLPQPRVAYVRTGRFTGKTTPDLYVWAGTPLVRSLVLDGLTGTPVWERGQIGDSERYWGPSVNLASVFDYDADGCEDLVFTNPDYFCVASGMDGKFLAGPLYPPEIFKQPSQGLYTFPALLQGEGKDPLVCLVDGHYFQAAMTLRAEPMWYKLPPPGENRSACEGFLNAGGGQWLMGFGRQNGQFACVDVGTGNLRWNLPIEATCSDTIACDIDGDGRQEFVFGTSHGALYALADNNGAARVLWRYGLPAGSGAPIAADLDGDGRSEIAVPTAGGRVLVLAARS